MGRTIEERKEFKWCKKGKEKKNQENQLGEYKNLKNRLKNWDILVWTSNEILRRKIERKSIKKEEHILQKLKKWANQQLNKDEELIYERKKGLINIVT